ncbi:MAG: hypothetical protein EOP83_11475 [Verrucomicrobiaceae bacterium]|nr:MAG: hypothetical protein EOP83_11475 [Verrucomicrobiaceae bacterium]
MDKITFTSASTLGFQARLNGEFLANVTTTRMRKGTDGRPAYTKMSVRIKDREISADTRTKLRAKILVALSA